MSFQIFVMVPQAAIPMPVNPHDWEKWARECGKLILFEEPLGSDGTVYTFWSNLAGQLDLPMLASLYHHGLHLETEQQLKTLEIELDILEGYWQAHLLDELAGNGHQAGSLLEDLEERLRHFRRAIRLAGEMKAVLFIEQPT